MEIEKVLEDRRVVYNFFATLLLSPPTRTLAEDIFNGIEIPYLGKWDEIAKDFKDINQFESSLRSQFSNLFLNPFTTTVSPYQSSYEGEEPYGKTTLRIYRKYQEMGYEFKYSEPADHIGVELLFMAESCQNAINSEGLERVKELRNQKKFLDEELKWAFSFCNMVEKNDHSPFYRKVCEKLREFLKKEETLISELVRIAEFIYSCQ